MPITFEKFSTFAAATWKIGKAIYDWASNKALQQDFGQLLSVLEHRRVLYAEWQYETMPAVSASLSEILSKIRDFRSRHPDNVELGVLLGELIVVLQTELDKFHRLSMHNDKAEFAAYKGLLTVRSELARTLAILCGKTGVSPRGTDLQRFIMDMALVRPKT